MALMPKLTRVAVLLSTRFFEDFYGAGLGLSRSEYLARYRNDWSWDWCCMLRREDVEASLYVPTIHTPERVLTNDGFAVRFLGLGAVATPWVRFSVLERSPLGRYVGQLANTAAFLRPLRAALRADAVDVLCVQEYWTGRFDVLVRALDTPVVVVDQGLPDRHELKPLKRGSFARCAAVVVQTEEQARRVSRYGGRGQRIPNAVDARHFCPGPEPARGDERVVLCVGRIHDAQKRLSDVIGALALLEPGWRLEIAGTGPDRPMLEALAVRLGVAARVRYLGFVGDSTELRELYRRASVLALPSAYEGLPMVLLEAMSCGLPVVGSDIPAIAEVVRAGRSGLLVPPGDVHRIAAGLREAVARGTELGRAARQSILATYDQRVVAPRLAATLRRAHARQPYST